MGYKPLKPAQCITETYEAESALTAGYAVIFGTSEDQCDVPASANDQCLGINRWDRTSGQKAEIVLWGPTEAVAGTGGVTKGDLVSMDANGKLVTITPGTTTSDLRVVGKAFTTAAADAKFTCFVGLNDFIQV